MTTTTTTTAQELSCGHAPTPDTLGTGYATTQDGRRLCYPCADDMQREELKTVDRFGAYLSMDGKHVTTWTGGQLATITQCGGNGRQIWARARDDHGGVWICQGAGPGSYLGMRRAAPPRGQVWALWHGGHGNYSPGELARDCEVFESRTAAREALRDRAENGAWRRQDFRFADGREESTFTPNADLGAMMTVYLRDPREEWDPYPDFMYEYDRDRGAVRLVRA